MPRTCTVCRHHHRQEIDLAIMASEPLRAISRKNCISTTALFRHKAEHLTPMLKSVVVNDEHRVGNLFDRLQQLHQTTWEILQECRATGNHHTALAAIGRIERQIELEAKLTTGPLRNAAEVAMEPEPDFDAIPTPLLTEARDLMERVQAILSGHTANSNECEDGIPFSLTAPTTLRTQKLLAAPLDNGTVMRKSAASHWTDKI